MFLFLSRVLVHEHKHLKAISGNFLVTEEKFISHVSGKDFGYDFLSSKKIA